MSDTEFSDLATTDTIEASDSILVVRGGLPHRFTGPLPQVDEGGLLYANNGLRILGPAPQPAVVGSFSFEHPVTRVYVGDGTGYSFRYSVRPDLVTITDVVTISDSGRIGIGINAPNAKLHVNSSSTAATNCIVGNNTAFAQLGVTVDGLVKLAAFATAPLVFGATDLGAVNKEYARFDTSGNLIVGVNPSSVSWHRIGRTVTVNAGNAVASFENAGGAFSALFYGVSGGLGSAANAACKVATDAISNRSINSGGTINASGADYAEYMTKAEGCGTIEKGDVCGVDANGLLTLAWSEAIAFMIKSTDPNLVGGDTWSANLADKPTPPAPIAPEPTLGDAPEPFNEPQPAREEDEDDASFGARFAAWQASSVAAAQAQAAFAEAASTFPDRHAAWTTAKAEFDAAQAAYETDLPVWEAALEAARQKVDRIAFCGQVPVNFTGTCQPGDYLIAVQDGDGIGIAAVSPADMTLPQYMNRLGKVLAIRDGRPWIDVQHG